MKQELVGLIMDAMKSKDQVRVDVLRSIKTEFMKFETAKNAPVLDGEAEVGVLKAMVKQRKQSVEEFSKANRQDLADKEIAEISIIEEFLPKMVSEDELKGAILATIKTHGIDSMKGMGIVMSSLKSSYGSLFDAGLANKLFKQELGL